MSLPLFSCFCHRPAMTCFVTILLRRVLSSTCCRIIVSLIVSFFMSFRVEMSKFNPRSYQIKSCPSICYKYEILSILGIFGLSNIYIYIFLWKHKYKLAKIIENKISLRLIR